MILVLATDDDYDSTLTLTIYSFQFVYNLHFINDSIIIIPCPYTYHTNMHPVHRYISTLDSLSLELRALLQGMQNHHRRHQQLQQVSVRKALQFQTKSLARPVWLPLRPSHLRLILAKCLYRFTNSLQTQEVILL